jgi:hypothetical protein
MIEVLKQALAALGNSWTEPGTLQYEIEQEAITAVTEAIAELESQEPVAWQFMNGSNFRKRKPNDFADLDSDGLPYWKPLYTTPPQRTWIGLTDEEVNNAIKEKNITPLFTYRMIARAIEAKLKEKNCAG